MTVMKFGGAVLNSEIGFRNMLKIIKSCESDKVLIVVSAFAKSTRNLKQAALIAESGDYEASEAIACEVIDTYFKFANQILTQQWALDRITREYEASTKKLNDLLRGVSITRELTKRTLDAVLSFGEHLALHTTYIYFQENGINVLCENSEKFIKTDDNYGSARPILEICENNINDKLLPSFAQYNVIVIQGFVASSLSNEITTMGIESSNLSAALYAKYLKADELIIYTDVQGIRTSDPKLSADTECVKQLSYDQAYLLGVSGVKLIFADMIEIIKSANMIFIIKSAFVDDGEYTTIKPDCDSSDKIIRIEKDSLFMIKAKFTSSIESTGMNDYCLRSQVVADEYFSITKSECIMVSSENHSMWVSADSSYYSQAVKLLSFVNLSNNPNKQFKTKINEAVAEKNNIELLIDQSNICRIYYSEVA